jgi:eukaryotic-like serine/threonine-protein kinase
MGEVYAATDELLEREVAVKLLSDRYAENDEIRRRFTREALAAARLSGQRYVVTIYDVGEHEGRPYIVMAYMAGGSVEQRVRREAPAAVLALSWVEQAGIALDRAHREGIVHRDVKPGNLLLDAFDVVHVGDFGIARATGLDSLTSPGTILGTVGYLAPEQAEGASASPASDRYALGVVAFELLTGRRPFDGDTPTTELLARATRPPARAHDANPELPPELDRAFDSALAMSPRDRPGTCEELVSELRAAFWGTESTTLVHPGAAARDEPVTVITPPQPRHRVFLAVGIGLLVFALAGAAVGVLALRPDRGNDAPSRAALQPPNRQQPQARHAAQAPAPMTHAPQGAPRRSTVSASQMNDEGFARLRAGDAGQALPLLERAVSELRGSGSITEAYASYNLAWARFALGRCDGVAGLLHRSEVVQGYRKEIAHLRKQLGKHCDRGDENGQR